MSLRTTAVKVVTDLRNGRHREAYSIFALGLVLTGLGIFGVVSQTVLLSSLLLAVTFLVFATTFQLQGTGSVLEEILQTRDALGVFSAALSTGGELWVYGPTAVNVLVNAADIRRKILACGGQVRVMVQDPDSPAVQFTKAQLDDNLDFDRVLASSIATLQKMCTWGACEYRLLPFNPGFSMVFVNPNRPAGFLVLELHGFCDDSIADRMHVCITRAESLRWFDYWTARFEKMWQQSRTDERQERSQLKTELD